MAPYFCSVEFNWRPAYAIGCSFPSNSCDSTAPTATFDASVASVNGLLKSGNLNTGASVNFIFIEEKAICSTSPQWNGFLVVSCVK